ncbi:MAG TPA: prolyl oligopeptidase family serine peptidase [Solirubrobacteraceae bacterium]|nr:prolyl oligopeptidase family serine peptidase [Solirubrobacteraceae bacterium]
MTSHDQLPPVARRTGDVRSLHGIDRPDPYAWLRDTSSPETLAHLRAERAYYDAATAPLRPLRHALAEEFIARLPREDVSAAWPFGAHAYFEHRPDGAEFTRLMRVPRGQSPDPEAAELLIDPAQLDPGSGYVGLGVRLVSPDERMLAYSVDFTGQEAYELRFRDLASGEDLFDRVSGTHYGGAWSADARTFFYLVHDDAWRPHQLWRHTLGTSAAQDVLVLEEPDEQFSVDAWRTRSGALIVVHLTSRDTSEVWLIDAERPHEAPRLVERRRRGIEYVVEHAPGERGDALLIVTNDGAQEFRVLTAPLITPGRDHWTELVPECPEERIYGIDAFAGHTVTTYRRDGELRLRIHARHGGEGADAVPIEITPSAPGSALGLFVNPEFAASEILISEESATRPRRWEAVDLATGARRLVRETVIEGHDPASYLTERRTFPAPDGTPIPATIIRHRDTPLDGTAPALIDGYGSYEIVYDPQFDETLPSLLDRGIVHVEAHVRGGGEGGRRWWLDGRLEHKQNTFSDLIAVAEGLGELVDRTRIATRGASAGGLLQGAVLSQRPELWRAMIAMVPFVDVVTTMLDETLPLTAAERDEWGDPRRADDFRWMLAYSPYDNIPQAGGRPDLLVTGAVHDPRVGVHEPAKWVQALRQSDPDWAPRCLFRCEVEEGSHMGPAGRIAALRQAAELRAWLLDRLGVA